MTYDEALKEVNKRLRFGSKLGLERMTALLNKMDNPQNTLRYVHVAGTNGKGTTCTYIASILQAAGYKVGLYTSPYVVDFRERFQIDGEMISEKELVKQVEKLSPVADSFGDDITEFEFITALGFNWFAEKQCDIVVLEVGLGGRFDATNVIECPDVAVIASISLDHTAILGDTIEKIAFEKAGIIKKCTSVAMYPAQNEKALDVFEKICESRGVPLYSKDISHLSVGGDAGNGEEDLFGTDFIIGGEKYHIPFSGIHQVYNAVNAITTVEILRLKGWRISQSAVKEGLENAKIVARMEVLNRRPLIILDGGHNPDCAAALERVLEHNLAGAEITAIIGMMADKDTKSYLAQVVPHFSKVITVCPDNPRSMSADSLAAEAGAFCADAIAAKNNEQAVELALESDVVVVCGSFYMVGEIRPLLLAKI